MKLLSVKLIQTMIIETGQIKDSPAGACRWRRMGVSREREQEGGGQEKRFGDSAEEECKEKIEIFSCLCCTGVKLQSAAVLFEFLANLEQSGEMRG